jgi:hypothetical protein
MGFIGDHCLGSMGIDIALQGRLAARMQSFDANDFSMVSL